ncbi:MAG: hypothetical protein V1701_10260 [Planctomycetota bacterium]
MYHLKAYRDGLPALVILALIGLAAGCASHANYTTHSTQVLIAGNSVTIIEQNNDNCREASIEKEGKEIKAFKIKENGVERAPTPDDKKWVSKYVNLDTWVVSDGASPTDEPVKSEIKLLVEKEQIDVGKAVSEIKKLHYSSDKKEYLLAMANRKDLLPADCELLAAAALDIINFDSEKTEVLTAVINNPYADSKTRKLIFDNIDRVAFDSDKIKLMKLLLQRAEKDFLIEYN